MSPVGPHRQDGGDREQRLHPEFPLTALRLTDAPNDDREMPLAVLGDDQLRRAASVCLIGGAPPPAGNDPDAVLISDLMEAKSQNDRSGF